ncbi:CNP1-like family protein [Ramlibacter albus]|uniref:CNP1-like family protein n=1 Tax=Ramlibacter albus TaxID=2079448 RepID=A0A923S2K2_9BURK|nr:CNP1-like family protein [Ramlibacter albus]MBC5765559.1 CNP1-like family protein [Ramlibacter albus]
MRISLAAACALAAPLAFAQLGTQDPDWKEVDAPPPPALRTEKLIEVEVPRATLNYGVDPASVSVGKDGIVRYVVVASAPGGPVSGIYEGIRCGTAEVKVYARHNAGSGWKPVVGGDWRPIHDGAFRHSLYIARNGACSGHTPGASATQVVRELSAGVDRRGRTDSHR